MRLHRLLPLALALAACPRTPPDDTSDTDVDADTDADTDSDTDADTDTDLQDDSIYDVQSGTILPDAAVRLADVVVTSPQGEDGFFVQEPDGGPYSGVWVYVYEMPAGVVEPGDLVTIVGTVNEYFDQTEISTNGVQDLEVTGTGALPAAQPVTYAAMDDAGQDHTALEPLEGCLVTLPGGAVAVGPDTFGDWLAATGPDSPKARVDTLLYRHPVVAPGDTFDGVVGPLSFAYEKFRISPRSAADLPNYVHPEIDCGADTCAEELVAGDLVLTELMNNPDAGDGKDESNEWVEVYNATSGSVNLKGVVLVDAGNGQGLITADAIVAAGDYALIATGDGTGWAYPVTPDAYWGAGVMTLNNSGTETLAIKVGNDVIDDIPEYAAPGGKGISWQLKAGVIDGVGNNTIGDWCAGTAAIATTPDFGTPGAANSTCP